MLASLVRFLTSQVTQACKPVTQCLMHSGACSLFTVKAAHGLWGNDLITGTVASLSECCDACNANPSCTSFTYYRGGCYMKNGIVANWETSDANWPSGYPASLSSGFTTVLKSPPPGKIAVKIQAARCISNET